jgi:iron(III) transport system substrate-binding protein
MKRLRFYAGQRELRRAGDRRMKTAGFLCLALVWLFISPSRAKAQDTESALAPLLALSGAERERTLVEEAKKEGEVIGYANLNIVAAKKLTEGFMKKYPFLKARTVHFSGAAIINRLRLEARAGNVLSDVVLSGQLGVLALLEKGVAARYLSPQREFYAEGLKDKAGYWTAMFTNLMVSVYNTNAVKKAEVPRRLEDLLLPRWKGKLAMDTQSYVWFGAVLQYLGEEAGLRFMKKLNGQDLEHFRGRRLMTQLVAAGESEMAVETNLNSVLSISEKGGPVWFAPIKPLFLSPSLLYLSQNAPHPHAGALFIDYLLSEDGQKVLRKTDRTPAHSKVEPAESKFLKGLDIRVPDIREIGLHYNEIGNQYREVFPGAN